MDEKEIAEKYQDLSDLLNQEHGLILLTSEMDEIIIECAKFMRDEGADKTIIKAFEKFRLERDGQEFIEEATEIEIDYYIEFIRPNEV